MERIVESLFRGEKRMEDKFLFAREESIYRVAASLRAVALNPNFKDL